MLMKLIFPHFAFGASVVDFLGAEKPVVIIDEFEVQGNHLEAFLDLHHSIITDDNQKSEHFLKYDSSNSCSVVKKS